MKCCTVYGEMSADSAADQYPTVNLCNECVDADASAKEDAQIVSIEGDYDPGLGDSCEWCGVEVSDEQI